MEGLLPLKHFDFALETIGILGDDTKVSIAEVHLVVHSTAQMNQFVFVAFIDGLHRVDLDTSFSSTVDQSSETNSSSLILPQHDVRERY